MRLKHVYLLDQPETLKIWLLAPEWRSKPCKMKSILIYLGSTSIRCHVFAFRNYALLPPKTNFSNSAEPLFSRSAYRYFATKPDFASLPSDWTIVVMANNSNGPHPGRVHANCECRFRTLTPHGVVSPLVIYAKRITSQAGRVYNYRETTQISRIAQNHSHRPETTLNE